MEALAQLANTTASQINKLEKGDRRLTDEWMRRLAAALNCRAAELMSELGGPPESSTNVSVPEVKMPAPTKGFIETAKWSLPEDYVRGELRADPSKICFLQVGGEAMSPTLSAGDRVMFDTSDNVPSPSGLFAVWNGVGLDVRRIELIPNSSPPLVRIKSDNPGHDDYERPLKDVTIVGRIIWTARRSGAPLNFANGMADRQGQPDGRLQQLWQEWKQCEDKARQLWARSVQLHAEGDRKGGKEAERDARLAEVRAREVEERITDVSARSVEDALVYARLLADFIGDGLLDDRRDALIASKLIVALENLANETDPKV